MIASALNKTAVEVMLQNRSQSYIQEVLRYEGEPSISRGLVTNNQPDSPVLTNPSLQPVCEKALVVEIPGLQGCRPDPGLCAVLGAVLVLPGT